MSRLSSPYLIGESARVRRRKGEKYHPDLSIKHQRSNKEEERLWSAWSCMSANGACRRLESWWGHSRCSQICSTDLQHFEGKCTSALWGRLHFSTAWGWMSHCSKHNILVSKTGHSVDSSMASSKSRLEPLLNICGMYWKINWRKKLCKNMGELRELYLQYLGKYK